MELVNHTAFPAALFRTVIDDDRFAAALVARVAYDIQEERLAASDQQTWIVSAPPWSSEYGPMESDEIFYRDGVDLFVFGHARTIDAEPATELDVTIEVGAFRRTLRVFGRRVWQRRRRRLVASAPEPFTSVPLTPAYAFGGRDRWDGLDIASPHNPDGIGFYLEEGTAEGRELPQVEDPDRLVQGWDDRPEPACVIPCPMDNGLRLTASAEFDEEGALTELRPSFFNQAFPAMIVRGVQAGDRVYLNGVAESGPLTFTIPRTELTARLRFGDEVIVRPLVIDQIGIEVDRRRVFLTYRYPFRYVLHPLQRRSCELDLSSAAPPSTLEPRP